MIEKLSWDVHPRVLVACDDDEIGEIWAHGLQGRGMEVLRARICEEAYHAWGEHIPDLVLIDAGTEPAEAITLTKRLREESVTPILVLSSWMDEAHILDFYLSGADECVPKPVSPALFLAKVTAWLRRAWNVPAEGLDSLHVGDLRLDPARRVLELADGSAVKLTNLEFRLMHLLMRHPGRTIETETLIERIWGYSGNGDSTLLKNVIYRLRRKIEPQPNSPVYIHTEVGLGYQFKLPSH